jgi:hypothetical protein
MRIRTRGTRRRVAAAVVIFATAALGLAGTALGDDEGGSEVRPVTAQFTAAPAAPPDVKPCESSNGTILIVTGRIEGNIVGSPELTGALRARFRTVFSLQNGFGYTRATVEIRDPATERVKFTGRLTAVDRPDFRSQGLLTGETRRPHATLIGTFTAAQNPVTGAITGQVGADAPVAPANAAIVTSGCDGGDD